MVSRAAAIARTSGAPGVAVSGRQDEDALGRVGPRPAQAELGLRCRASPRWAPLRWCAPRSSSPWPANARRSARAPRGRPALRHVGRAAHHERCVAPPRSTVTRRRPLARRMRSRRGPRIRDDAGLGAEAVGVHALDLEPRRGEASREGGRVVGQPGADLSEPADGRFHRKGACVSQTTRAVEVKSTRLRSPGVVRRASSPRARARASSAARTVAASGAVSGAVSGSTSPAASGAESRAPAWTTIAAATGGSTPRARLS